MKATDVNVERIASRSELQQVLEASVAGGFWLGRTAEAPREFFVIRVQHHARNETMIGVSSHGIGVSPACLVTARRMFVGFNDRLAVFCVETTGLILDHELDLMSLFIGFAGPPSAPIFCVIAEAAVVGVSSETGLQAWRVDTDLITFHEIQDGILNLRFADVPGFRIDMVTGNRME